MIRTLESYVDADDKYIHAPYLDRAWRLRGLSIRIVAISFSTAPSTLVAHDTSQALSIIMNTLAHAWTLQIEISQCFPEDDPRGGVQTKRIRKGCTEERCQPGKADVRFVIPDGGITVRGDFHASFRSVIHGAQYQRRTFPSMLNRRSVCAVGRCAVGGVRLDTSTHCMASSRRWKRSCGKPFRGVREG